MNINLQILYSDDTTKDVSANPADIVAFEAHFDLSIAKLQENIRLTHLFFLAWHVEKRTGATTAEFEKWLESVEGVEAVAPKK